MNEETHPIITTVQKAFTDAVILNADDDLLADVVAHRLLTLHGRHINATDLATAYGQNWQSVVGFLTLVNDLNPDELHGLADEYNQHRLHLNRLTIAWMCHLGTDQIASDVRADIRTLHDGNPRAQAVLAAVRLRRLLGISRSDAVAFISRPGSIRACARPIAAAEGRWCLPDASAAA